MAKLATPAGDLTLGQRYTLTLRRGDAERVLANAVVEATAAEPIGHCPTCTCQEEPRYQARTVDQLIGFLPEHVITAEAR